MKILKNAGTFKVLSKTEDVLNQIARAARTCYQSEEFASDEKDEALIKNLMKRGHYAMIEFADMTVQFNNVCRGFTHEMVRHRLCDFAQESTRYVDESDFKVVVPPHKDEHQTIITINPLEDESFGITLHDWFRMNEQAYRSLRENGWKPEDARQVLPIGIKSQIVVKANLREWMHIFDMRCSKAAHWEIRGVMLELLAWSKRHIPIIFSDYKIYSDDGKIKIYADRG